MLKRFSALLIFVVLAFAGCSGKSSVTGKVTYDDGSPLTRGSVCFQTDKYFAEGPLQSDGSYTLGALKAGEGVPPGTYQVFINGAIIPPDLSGRGDSVVTSFDAPEFLVDNKFTSPLSSGLTCTVKGKTVFDITVSKP